MQLTPSRERRLRHLVYWAGFFLNLSLAIAAYINSSLFENFVGEQKAGLIYTLTYLLTFCLALYFHRVVERLGVHQIIKHLLLISLVSLAGISILTTNLVSIFFLAINLVVSFLLVASLDLYLEHLSSDKETGRIRGWFLALNNSAWLLSPLLASQLNTHYGFSAIYLSSALALVPLAYFAFRELVDLPRRTYHHVSISRKVRELWRAASRETNAQIRRIILIDFLLQFFYAVMVVYLPILLHEHIGFSWSQIGVILTLMLVPFVIIDLVLGRAADEWLGEKELLTAGIAIAGLSTLIIPFLGIQSIWAWGGILFASRVGAATIELMKDSYLFKKVDSEDVSVIFLSRAMYPLSYIIGPLIGSLILIFAPIQTVFSAMGFIVLIAGLPLALRLRDTK